jgi:hypothetical protein
MVMHTLFFESHSAVLDPETGMGALLLPDPKPNGHQQTSWPARTSERSAARRWFGSNRSEYDTIIHDLSRIGWELPKSTRGAALWCDAGNSECCGRPMVRLVGVDYAASDPSQSSLSEAIERMNDFAVWTCCGIGLFIESLYGFDESDPLEVSGTPGDVHGAS